MQETNNSMFKQLLLIDTSDIKKKKYGVLNINNKNNINMAFTGTQK